MQFIRKSGTFLCILYGQAHFFLSVSIILGCSTFAPEEKWSEKLHCNCSHSIACMINETTESPRESTFTLQFPQKPVDDRRVVEKILMHGFIGEMHLDAEKITAASLRPLNINTSMGTRDVSGSFFNFFDHKPTFKVDSWEQRKVTLGGGPLTAPYIMDQFHFHVYCTRKEAEESTLDRVQVPGELHLVFFREKYSSYSNAMLRYKDGLAVVAIYLEVGDENSSNAQIANFSSLVDYISEDQNRKLSATAAIKQLTSPLDKGNAQYDAYRGNLVEPLKCKDCVDVFVMEERFSISVKEMTEFRKAPHCVENDWAF